jgi:hypothetical protein
MLCAPAPGREIQEKDITVGHQNRAAFQIQVIGVRDGRVMVPVQEKCFSA